MTRLRRVARLVPHDVEETGEMVLLDPDTDSVVALNASAAAIWWLCDGTRGTHEIAHEVSRTLPAADADTVRADVARATDDLLARGLVEQTP